MVSVLRFRLYYRRSGNNPDRQHQSKPPCEPPARVCRTASAVCPTAGGLQIITPSQRTIETVNPCPTSSMSGAAQTTRFSGRINHKPFHSNDFRAIVVADSRPRVSFRLFRNLPGFAFIRFPYFLRLNTVSFLTIEGEIYQLLRSVSI